MPRAADAKPSALLGTWGPGDLGTWVSSRLAVLWKRVQRSWSLI